MFVWWTNYFKLTMWDCIWLVLCYQLAQIVHTLLQTYTRNVDIYCTIVCQVDWKLRWGEWFYFSYVRRSLQVVTVENIVKISKLQIQQKQWASFFFWGGGRGHRVYIYFSYAYTYISSHSDFGKCVQHIKSCTNMNIQCVQEKSNPLYTLS